MGGNALDVIRVLRAGTVISCRRITGCLSIEARGVTVRDVRIRCTSGRTGEDANGTSVIAVRNGASATLKRVTIDGMRGVHACVWHEGDALSMSRVNCRGVNDGVFSWSTATAATGSNFTIRDSFFHDFTTRTANGHIDGYQTEGASNGRIIHNTFLMTSDDNDNSTDSAIAVWDGQRDSSDISVEGNLIAGGGFSVYAHDYSPSQDNPAGGNSVTDVRFGGNVFSTRLFGCVGYYGVWFPRGAPTDGWRRGGNTVLETGADVDGMNPTYAGRTCS